MTLPCKIEGFPVLNLTQIEERVLQVLADGRVHKAAEIIRAVWDRSPPQHARESLWSVIYRLRTMAGLHGYLLTYEREVGYALIKDTRKFD